MSNSMPQFAVYRFRNFCGYVNAVSYEQALKRARKLYGRCEVMACGNVKMNRSANTNGRSDMSYTHGRSPCPTPGFEARRAALIAEHKANH